MEVPLWCDQFFLKVFLLEKWKCPCGATKVYEEYSAGVRHGGSEATPARLQPDRVILAGNDISPCPT